MGPWQSMHRIAQHSVSSMCYANVACVTGHAIDPCRKGGVWRLLRLCTSAPLSKYTGRARKWAGENSAGASCGKLPVPECAVRVGFLPPLAQDSCAAQGACHGHAFKLLSMLVASLSAWFTRWVKNEMEREKLHERF